MFNFTKSPGGQKFGNIWISGSAASSVLPVIPDDIITAGPVYIYPRYQSLMDSRLPSIDYVKTVTLKPSAYNATVDCNIFAGVLEIPYTKNVPVYITSSPSSLLFSSGKIVENSYLFRPLVNGKDLNGIVYSNVPCVLKCVKVFSQGTTELSEDIPTDEASRKTCLSGLASKLFNEFFNITQEHPYASFAQNGVTQDINQNSVLYDTTFSQDGSLSQGQSGYAYASYELFKSEYYGTNHCVTAVDKLPIYKVKNNIIGKNFDPYFAIIDGYFNMNSNYNNYTSSTNITIPHIMFQIPYVKDGTIYCDSVIDTDSVTAFTGDAFHKTMFEGTVGSYFDGEEEYKNITKLNGDIHEMKANQKYIMQPGFKIGNKYVYQISHKVFSGMIGTKATDRKIRYCCTGYKGTISILDGSLDYSLFKA